MILTIAFVALVGAASDPFEAGVDYQLIEPARPSAHAEKVDVVEFFGYTCPHCANFQPYIDSWSEKLDDDGMVNYRRVPVVFGRGWEPFAKAFYVSEALGVLEQSHGALFSALHERRETLRTDEDLAEFFTQFGVSEDEYLRTAKSFAVQTKVRQGMELARQMGVSGTPTVVVDGKYRLQAQRGPEPYPRLMEVVQHLVDKEASTLQPVAAEAVSS